MPIPSLNWQTAHAWLLAHEGYWVLGTAVRGGPRAAGETVRTLCLLTGG